MSSPEGKMVLHCKYFRNLYQTNTIVSSNTSIIKTNEITLPLSLLWQHQFIGTNSLLARVIYSFDWSVLLAVQTSRINTTDSKVMFVDSGVREVKYG